MRGPASPLRRLVGALTLSGLLLAGVAESGSHLAGGLHGQRLGDRDEVSSGCTRRHAPELEPRLGVRQVDCPACLLQLQVRGVASERAAAPSPPVMAAAVTPCQPADRLDGACRFTAPRGPPGRG